MNKKDNTDNFPDNFFDALKNDPEKIIKWAEDEINEYKKLIKLIKKQK